MHAVGVDVGGTKILTGLVTDAGEVVRRHRIHTPQEGPEAVADAIADSVSHVLAGLPRVEVCGVGVGVPGPLNPETGVVYQPPNLRGWDTVPLGDLLSARIALPVRLENDADAAAIGEWWAGAGRGVSDLVYITVSTGVGGGIIVAGSLVRGVSGTAGEVGHMTIDPDGPRCHCGNTGCLEMLASGPAIARMAADAIRAGRSTTMLDLAGGDPDSVTAKTVADAARAGDPLAGEIYERAGTYLGIGIANLLNLLNPARIIIGGGVSKAGSLLFDPARRTARQRAFERPARDAEIVPAGLGDDAGAIGAAATAFLRSGRELRTTG